MLKKYKPTTPGRRKASIIDTRAIQGKPLKSLTKIRKQKAGRSKGRITVRHQGGGHKRFIRIVDFKRIKYDIPGIVKSIEYDPNRTANIALIFYKDGAKSYIIAPKNLKKGDTVLSSKKSVKIEPANRMPLKEIPTGTQIYNIEFISGQGGKMIRSAGAAATLMSKGEDYAQVKLPSSEIRRFPINVSASIGQVSNPEWRFMRWGKAGRKRHVGIRPSVRGKAMAPVAHPHGGREGGGHISRVHPMTPWGKTAYGVKTRNKKKSSNKFIIRRRIKKRK
ncbi:MAG TPA: 50S ribosomal protein L2 [Patescibacteria group bacterium]|nr:50S ribosomal protein L2 [Patescibacteria group bacterium]